MGKSMHCRLLFPGLHPPVLIPICATLQRYPLCLAAGGRCTPQAAAATTTTPTGTCMDAQPSGEPRGWAGRQHGKPSIHGPVVPGSLHVEKCCSCVAFQPMCCLPTMLSTWLLLPALRHRL